MTKLIFLTFVRMFNTISTIAIVIQTAPATLGRPGSPNVFVTADKDIKGLNASQVANKFTIPESSTGYTLIEFPTPTQGLASPINSTNAGFVGFGRTLGGAREFTLPNQPIPANAVIRFITTK